MDSYVFDINNKIGGGKLMKKAGKVVIKLAGLVAIVGGIIAVTRCCRRKREFKEGYDG